MTDIDAISPAAEAWLRLHEAEFSCELANHAIHSEHVTYPSSREATLAMLRGAYLKGVTDRDRALNPPDFEQDVAQIQAVNEAAHR